MTSAPVQPKQRIQYLDVIRGFAISGVLLAYVFWNLGTEPDSSYTSFDKSLDKILSFLIDSKCYTILANLFAVGFVLHMNKSGSTAGNLYTYRRRLLGLIIIGIAHALVLRNGDILVPYAVLTFLVIFLYRASNRTIIFVMIITFLLEASMPSLFLSQHWAFPKRPAGQGNYWVENFEWVKYWYATSIFFWEMTLFFLLSGLLAGRYFIQKKKKLTSTQLILIVIIGFVSGFASYWFINSPFSNKIRSIPDIGNTFIVRKSIYDLLFMIHRVGLAAAYVSLFYLLLSRFTLNALAVLGRTSLSNYIMQAIIVVPICLAFNLFDHITPTIALIMTVSIWIFQVLFSNWWLKYHRFGPLEGLLRRFTYRNAINAEKQIVQTQLVVSEA
ncbi:MAG TPA: DUF418 domain-containing protein [Chitinophagaceae bacterium]|nr:DUF418 domain-containing protein [Chitinophagaceae bacterium]